MATWRWLQAGACKDPTPSRQARTPVGIFSKLRDEHIPDTEGRAVAGTALLLQLLQCAEEGGLEIKPEPRGRDRRRIGLPGMPWAYVIVSSAYGDILMGELNDEPIDVEWEYDPTRKAYVGKHEDQGGPSAVELLAKQVAEALHKKNKKKAAAEF